MGTKNDVVLVLVAVMTFAPAVGATPDEDQQACAQRGPTHDDELSRGASADARANELRRRHGACVGSLLGVFLPILGCAGMVATSGVWGPPAVDLVTNGEAESGCHPYGIFYLPCICAVMLVTSGVLGGSTGYIAVHSLESLSEEAEGDCEPIAY